MSEADTLRHLADTLGILPAYYDIQGNLREMSEDTRRALVSAMGFSLMSDHEAAAHLALLAEEAEQRPVAEDVIVKEGEPIHIPVERPVAWRLEAEAGNTLLSQGEASHSIDPGPLEFGLYHLHLATADWSGRTLLMVRPREDASVPLITGSSSVWGVTASLYGLRSARNLGLGDYADLGEAAEVIAGMGADFLGINPVHALGSGPPAPISPYSPAHRGFFNTAHIAPDKTPEFAHSKAAQQLLDRQAGEIEALRAAPMLDYQAVAALRRPVLEALFETFEARAEVPGVHDAFNAFCSRQDQALKAYAVFEALAEKHGRDWRAWPADLQHPEWAAVSDFAAQNEERVRFYQYLQYLADRQLGEAQGKACAAGMGLGLYLDIAVGVEPVSAEVWADPAAFAQSVSLGAPPDHFNPVGQRWGLAPFSPMALRQQAYAPFLRLLRATLAHAGLIRIDHALGMKRSFWVPEGIDGGYVAYPFQSMLAITAIEARRHNAAVIGEDLGVVPDDFRDEMGGAGLYGCTVLQFEREHGWDFRSPHTYRPLSIASFGTHDTPTMRGFWLARDIEWRLKVGHVSEEDGVHAYNERAGARHMLLVLLEREGLLPEGVDIHNPPQELSDELVEALHIALARGASELVAMQLDDGLGEVEQPNLPGTIDEHPNWRRRQSVAVGGLADVPLLNRLAAALRQARPRGSRC